MGKGRCVWFRWEDDVDEINYSVTAVVYPRQRGARGEYGVPMEPDEPAYAELESVEDPNGIDILPTLDQSTIDTLCEAAMVELRAQEDD